MILLKINLSLSLFLFLFLFRHSVAPIARCTHQCFFLYSMRHATGIRADVRMKREGDTRRPTNKDGDHGVIGSAAQRRGAARWWKYRSRKKEKERTHRGSQAHARPGLHMTRSVGLHPPSLSVPRLSSLRLSLPPCRRAPGLNSNRVVSPRRAVLRGCYSTRARKYATGGDVCVNDGACLLRRLLDPENWTESRTDRRHFYAYTVRNVITSFLYM